MRIYKLGLGVQFIFHIVKYKLKRYKSRSDLYLFAKVWCVGRNYGAHRLRK